MLPESGQLGLGPSSSWLTKHLPAPGPAQALRQACGIQRWTDKKTLASGSLSGREDR